MGLAPATSPDLLLRVGYAQAAISPMEDGTYCGEEPVGRMSESSAPNLVRGRRVRLLALNRVAAR